MSIYAAVDCEPIEVALLALLKANLPKDMFQTIGRQHVPSAELSAAQQPALFSVIVEESKASAPRGLTGKLILHGVLIVYFQRSGASEIPGQETTLGATQLNVLKKAIANALAPLEATGLQTLGGLVSHCWIEGDTKQDPGIWAAQGTFIVPIHILVP
jgi:hypothetical protein